MRKWAIFSAALLCVSAWGQSSQSAKPESAQSRSLEAPSASYPADLARSAAPPKITLPSLTLPSSTSVQVPRIVLPPLSEAEVQSVQNKPAKEMRARVGLTRKLEFSAAERGVRVAIEKDKELWMLETVSTGAKMVRLHFTGFDLPEGTKLYLSGVTGAENLVVLDGKGPYQDGDFWSPVFEGEAIRMELVGPVNGEGKLQVTQMGHVFAAKLEPAEVQSCHLDASCYPEWKSAGDSVARILFNDSQFIYACSAVLLNNNSGDFSPLLLTAHHCVETNALASTLYVYWRYRSSQCGQDSPNYFATSGGGRLLATTTISDASLIEAFVPLPMDQVVWAGWKSEDPALDEVVTSIHHPQASYQRISFGNIYPPVPDLIAFHHLRLSSGMAEGGSSGSPLFNSSRQVLGQLLGGNASCANPTGDLFYGKLGVSLPLFVSAEGRNYLQEGLPDDAFAPNQTRESAKLITAAGEYSDLVLKAATADWFRITVPADRRLTVSLLKDYTYNGSTLFRGDETQPLFTFNGQASITNLGETRDYTLKVTTVAARLNYGLRVELEAPMVPVLPLPEVYMIVPERAFVGGCIDGKGFPYEIWVEWSADATFASKLQSPVVSSMSGGFDCVPRDILHLLPDSDYYFRLVARNVVGTTIGPAQKSHTIPLALPYLQQPQDQGFVEHVNPATISFGAMGAFVFDVYVGTEPDPPFVQRVNGTSIILTLIPDTKYYIRIVAIYEHGTTSSGIKTFTTMAPTYFWWLEAWASPKLLTFEARLIGSTSPYTDVRFVNNNDFGWLNVSSVTTSGDFTAKNSCNSVSSGWYCPIEVAFRPSGGGLRTGTLNVFHANGVTTLNLAGVGRDMSLSVVRPTRPTRHVITAGQSETYSVMVTPEGGFAGEVEMSCTTAANLRCDAYPARLQVRGSPATVNVTASVPIRSQRLRRVSTSTVILKINATIQGMTKSIDLPVQIER